MAKIYLIRHAESIANTKGIYQGQTYNTALSPIGKKQAIALARALALEKLDEIIASPLLRTLATAEVLAKPHLLDISQENKIIETNHGNWEGRNKEFIRKKWPALYKTWINAPAAAVFPKGESFRETQTRVIGWWKETIKKDKDLAIISHDNILRIVIADVLGLNLNKIWRFHLLPTAITIVEVRDGVARLVLLNDDRHISDLKVDLSVHAL